LGIPGITVARQLNSSYLPTSTLDNSDRKEAAQTVQCGGQVQA